MLERPLGAKALRKLARTLGADMPFFLERGPQLGEEEGGALSPLDLPQDYWVVLLLPHGERKESSGAVYRSFDERSGPKGYPARRDALRRALARVRRPGDLAELPANDLASSPLADELRARGAFRADVSGAGPAIYGLFTHREHAERALNAFASRGRTWLTAPAWYV
jgi:4-diphosphocytidyl-2-C-methyl-D-erythritol kinase